MDLIDTFTTIYLSEPSIKRYVVPFLGCAVLYVIFRKTREFSFHAVQNTATTLIIFWMNLLLAVFFFEDISSAIQWLYAGLRIPALDAGVWDGVPLWAMCLIGIVINDFVYYWNHRFMHTTWGWPTHAAHHSDTHVNAFTVYRIHFLEWMLMVFSYFFLLTWLQMPEAIPVVAVLTSLHGLYVHMDLPFTHGPLRHVIASPVFHRWHHADVPEAYGKNLANIMPVWDVIFGTHYSHRPVPDTVEMGAVGTGVADKNPLMIYAYPVLEWSRLIRTGLSGVAGRSALADRGAARRGSAPTSR